MNAKGKKLMKTTNTKFWFAFRLQLAQKNYWIVLAVQKLPAIENILSDGANVAVCSKQSLAKVASVGSLSHFFLDISQFSSKCMVSTPNLLSTSLIEVLGLSFLKRSVIKLNSFGFFAEFSSLVLQLSSSFLPNPLAT